MTLTTVLQGTNSMPRLYSSEKLGHRVTSVINFGLNVFSTIAVDSSLVPAKTLKNWIKDYIKSKYS